MPVIEVDKDRLNSLLHHQVNDDELWELLFRFGMELDDVSEQSYRIEITPDRPDMLSLYGLSRALNSYMGSSNKVYSVSGPSGWTVIVDRSVKPIRPFIGSFIVKGIKLDEDRLKEIIRVQEKLHSTLCRNREVAAIGIYPYSEITPPITYRAEPPKEIRFVPLGDTEERTGDEILSVHPTGIEYAHLLEGVDRFPVLRDAKGRVLSMPPIINSETSGRVTVDTREFFVEVTGTRKVIVNYVLNILATMFIDMGGEVYSVDVLYEGSSDQGKWTTPDLSYRELTVDVDYINRILGSNLSVDEVRGSLIRMGYLIVSTEPERITVGIPPYRTDVLHVIDVVDDVGRAVSYDRLTPTLKPVFTIGGIFEDEKVVDRVREVLIGLSYVEVFTLGLTSEYEQFQLMNLDKDRTERTDKGVWYDGILGYVKVNKAKARDVDMLRYWLFPELLKSLRVNRERPYPIKMFEVSDVVRLRSSENQDDPRAPEPPYVNHKHLCVVLSDNSVTYTDIKQVLDRVFESLGYKVETQPYDHPSFIPGRCAEVVLNGKGIGIIGEVHPKVISGFDLTAPVVGFEVDLTDVLGSV